MILLPLSLRVLKMKSNDWLFATLPNWLRWIIAVPVAILLSLIIQLILSYTIHNVLGWSYNATIWTIVLIASVICVNASLFYCIPNYKSVITGGANLLLSVYFLALIALHIANGFFMDSINIPDGISIIVCICIAVKLLRKKNIEVMN